MTGSKQSVFSNATWYIKSLPYRRLVREGEGEGGNGAGRMECSNCLYVDLKETFLGLKHVKRQRGRKWGGGGFRFVTIKINLTPLLGSATLWWIPLSSLAVNWKSIFYCPPLPYFILLAITNSPLFCLKTMWSPPPTQKEKFSTPGLWIKKKSLMPQWS